MLRTIACRTCDEHVDFHSLYVYPGAPVRQFRWNLACRVPKERCCSVFLLMPGERIRLAGAPEVIFRRVPARKIMRLIHRSNAWYGGGTQ